MEGYKIVFPNAGLIIRDHVSKKIVPAEGMKVKMDSYWLRRISDGDVTAKEVVLDNAKANVFNKGDE